MQVDSIRERSRQTCAISSNLGHRADASSTAVAGISARAGIRSRNERELRGKANGARRSHHSDVSALEWLSHRVERMPRNLEQLVEKEHTAVCEADFTRPRSRAAADKSGSRDRMMRRAKGACRRGRH